MSNGSACVMSRGTAWRFGFTRIEEVAELIEHFGPDQALALGGIRSDLPARVEVVTKRKLNDATVPKSTPPVPTSLLAPATISPIDPALALVDYDTKGMPQSVADKIKELGGLWPALVSVIPELATVARVIRKSTSAGLFRADTGEMLPSTGGVHAFLAVQDGWDVERCLKTLHVRCWLSGLGWIMVGAGG
jgi:hypothetical protein